MKNGLSTRLDELLGSGHCECHLAAAFGTNRRAKL